MTEATPPNENGAGIRLAIVVARFNPHVTSALLDGAEAAVERLGVAKSATYWVPGAFELPIVALKLAKSAKYDAVICLGAIIHHETNHDVYVATQAANGILRVSMDTGVPCIFGVLTCETDDQAMDRAGGSQGNKGYDSVATAVDVVNTLRSI